MITQKPWKIWVLSYKYLDFFDGVFYALELQCPKTINGLGKGKAYELVFQSKKEEAWNESCLELWMTPLQVASKPSQIEDTQIKDDGIKHK